MDKRLLIEPLKGPNYATWLVQAKMALIKDSLYNLVTGTEAAPADTATQAVKSAYKVRADKALAIIVLSVDTSLLYLLENPEDPVAVWNTLSGHFRKKTWANKLQLRRKIINTRYVVTREGSSRIDSHIKIMSEIFSELTAVGDVISQEDRVVYLLASLPDEFSVLVTALEASKDVPDWETVLERLRFEELKVRGVLQHGDPSHEGSRRRNGVDAAAMYGRYPRKDGDRSGDGGSDAKVPQCFRCHQFGHVKWNCPKNKKSSKKKTQKKQASTNKDDSAAANHAAVDSVTTGADEVVALTVQALKASYGSSDNTGKWVIDSGASRHMSGESNLFENYIEFSNPINVTLGDERCLKAMGTGNIYINNNDDNIRYVLNDVLYVPELSFNLFSVGKCANKGHNITFNNNGCAVISKSGDVLVNGQKEGDLYYLNVHDNDIYCNIADTSDLELWHRRYGHLGITNLKKLVNSNMVEGFKGTLTGKLDVCEPCAYGKQHRAPFPVSKTCSKEVLELVHTDVCGKMEVKSLSGNEYFVTFIDDKSRYIWVYFLKYKSQVFQTFLDWKALAENEYEKRLKTLRSDRGGEYVSGEFEEYLTQNGIHHDKTVAHTPEQNGVAERANRTIVETVRSMLADGKLEKHFWAEAVNTAVYLRNRSPTVAVEGKTPHEALTGKKPQAQALRVFGAQGYAHIPKEERRKLDHKSRKCIFLGYEQGTKGYRLYNPDTGKVFISRDVILDEGRKESEDRKVSDKVPTQVKQNTGGPQMNARTEEQDKGNEAENAVDLEISDDEGENDDDPPGRPIRDRRQPDRYGEWLNFSQSDEEPNTFQQAMVSSNKAKWEQAMNSEIQSLLDHDAWELVDKLPKGAKALGSKWVFKEKRGEDGEIVRYKARLVAQGFNQRQGKDYDETFSPVVRSESVRTVLALAVKNKLKVHHMDVQTAFLNGELKEKVFIKQPEGFVSKNNPDAICKLKKSIYGLKQSSRCWNSALHDHLIESGYTQSVSDPCIYTASDGKQVIAIYVDDIILAAETDELLAHMKAMVKSKFDVSDLDELDYFLGVSIDQSGNGIWLGQPAYTRRVLERFGMEDCKPVSTPADPSVKLVKEGTDSKLADVSKYQSAVGSLLYISQWTRPDIAFAVSNVAKFCSKPTEEHYTAVKRIMRYLKGTIDHGLLYPTNESQGFVGFSDADWAGDINDRRSTSGYLFKLGACTISWRSKKQVCVALSTAEAEYIALSAAAQESVWLNRLLNELGECYDYCVIKEDNQSAISMSKNPTFHGRGKHIDIKYHFVRDLVGKRSIVIEYCPSCSMQADILTKVLDAGKFVNFKRLINVVKR